ncbi:Hypothetical predicted protein, partial [Podarcis lilfordi]
METVFFPWFCTELGMNGIVPHPKDCLNFFNQNLNCIVLYGPAAQLESCILKPAVPEFPECGDGCEEK